MKKAAMSYQAACCVRSAATLKPLLGRNEDRPAMIRRGMLRNVTTQSSVKSFFIIFSKVLDLEELPKYQISTALH